MAIKAALKIVLHANDTVVAESEDPVLWQKILVAINSPQGDDGKEPALALGGHALDASGSDDIDTSDSELAAFAKAAGVGADILEGACGPTKDSPYICLDHHHYDTFKRNTPTRGRGSVSPVELALTLLVLWKRYARLGETLPREASAVLATIDLNANNVGRTIKNSEWLQSRGEAVVLNPAKNSQALRLVRAYCLEQPPQED